MPKQRPSICITESVDQIDSVATGKKLRSMREEAGLALKPIATRMKRSVPYLSDLELGRRGWSEDRAQQFVAAIKELATKPPKRGAVPARGTLR